MQISLVKRLVLSSILMAVCTVVLICALFFYSTSKFSERYLGNELASKVEFLKTAYREPLWSFDKSQIDHVSNSILFKTPYSYVSYIKVESNDQEVLFEKDIDAKDRDQKNHLDHSHKIKFDIEREGQLIGHVTMIMTNKGSIKTIKKYLGYIIIISAICLIFFGFFIGLYYNKLLSNPLKQILLQVKHFEKDQFEHFDAKGLPYELQSVSRALNRAGEMIEKRNTDIKKYTIDLESTIEERTLALKEQIEKNVLTSRLASLGEMAAGVAHEINNPLTVIDLHIIKLKKSESDEAKKQSLEKIQSMIRRISTIIKGLKNLSRDGHQDPFVPFNVATMIEDVKVLVEMKLKTNNVDLECSQISNEVMVNGRVVQVSQVLVNLINNAIDAVNSTYKEKKWIHLDISLNEQFVQISIKDNGPGIPEHLKDKIMQPFFTTKEVNKGTGLGLSISKSIIEEHGGVLSLSSDSEGSTFSFSLVVAQEQKMAS